MADKIIAPFAILLFLAFIAFLAIYINEIDLWIVIIAVGAMGVFEFWQSLRGQKNGNQR